MKLNLLKAQNGEWSLNCNEGKGDAFLIHSGQNPSHEGENWAKLISIEEKTMYIVLGCGLGYHIKALYELLPSNSKIVVIVSQGEIDWLNRVQVKTPVHYLQNGQVLWLRRTEIYDAAVLIAEDMLKNRMKKVNLCPYRPAMRLAPVYSAFYKSVTEQIERAMSGIINVLFWNGKLFTENICRNLVKIARNPGVDRLSNLFSAETPVIVVGSGPSLDKNIGTLQAMRDKAVIIAAGSAMAALKKAEIVPHFLFVADATVKMHEVIKDSFFSETVLVSCYTVNSKIIEDYPGRMVFYLSQDVPNLSSLLKVLPKTQSLMQAVSVSTLAVDFARVLGSKKIIFVGQDLSYPYGGKHHAEGVDTIAYEGEGAMLVPGYDGDSVLTYPMLNAVIDFFSTYARSFPQIEFINATEGGAKIDGTKQVTLYEIKQKIELCQWGKITSDKIEKLIYSYKPKKQTGIIKVIKEYEKSLNEYASLLGDINKKIENFSTEEKLSTYIELFDNTAKKIVYEILEKMLVPRLQAISFYWQEATPEAEVCSMYEGMAKDLQVFCLYLASILKKACETIEGELANG